MGLDVPSEPTSRGGWPTQTSSNLRDPRAACWLVIPAYLVVESYRSSRYLQRAPGT